MNDLLIWSVIIGLPVSLSPRSGLPASVPGIDGSSTHCAENTKTKPRRRKMRWILPASWKGCVYVSVGNGRDERH